MRPMMGFGHGTGARLVAIAIPQTDGFHQIDIYEFSPGAAEPFALKYRYGGPGNSPVRFLTFGKSGELVVAEPRGGNREQLVVRFCR